MAVRIISFKEMNESRMSYEEYKALADYIRDQYDEWGMYQDYREKLEKEKEIARMNKVLDDNEDPPDQNWWNK